MQLPTRRGREQMLLLRLPLGERPRMQPHAALQGAGRGCRHLARRDARLLDEPRVGARRPARTPTGDVRHEKLGGPWRGPRARVPRLPNPTPFHGLGSRRSREGRSSASSPATHPQHALGPSRSSTASLTRRRRQLLRGARRPGEARRMPAGRSELLARAVALLRSGLKSEAAPSRDSSPVPCRVRSSTRHRVR